MKKISLIEIIERASVGAYGEESEQIGKLIGLINAAAFNHSWGPFICGAHGEPGPDGLHDSYAICPCYGADVQSTALYERVNLEANTKALEDQGGEYDVAIQAEKPAA